MYDVNAALQKAGAKLGQPYTDPNIKFGKVVWVKGECPAKTFKALEVKEAKYSYTKQVNGATVEHNAYDYGLYSKCIIIGNDADFKYHDEL